MVSFVFMSLDGKIAKLAETGVIRSADNDVVKDFDFQKLSGAYQVAGYFDVCFAGRGVAAGVIMG